MGLWPLYCHKKYYYYYIIIIIIASEASFLVCSMRGFSIYLYIYIFQAVRRAVNEMFETPDTVFNNLELLVNPSSTAEKCSATEDCCRNPGGDRRPSSTVKSAQRQDCCRIDRGVRGPASTDCRSVTEGKRRPSSTSYNWAGQKAMRSLRSSSLRSRDALHLSSCERSELPSLFNARIFYIFIYIYISGRTSCRK